MMNLLSYKVIYFRPNSSRKFKMAAMKTLLFFVHLIVPINAINKNVKSYCINKMTIYVSSSYSLSSVMFSFILAQMHRHCPHPVEQSNPVLLQKQRRVSHPILQLHRTNFSSAFWATSMSHCRDRTIVYPLQLSSQYHLWMKMWNKPWFPFPYLHQKVNAEAMVVLLLLACAITHHSYVPIIVLEPCSRLIVQNNEAIDPLRWSV